MNYLTNYIVNENNMHVVLNSFTQSLISFPWIFLKKIFAEKNINFSDFSWKISIEQDSKDYFSVTHLRTEKVKVLSEENYKTFFKFTWKLILKFEIENGVVVFSKFQMVFVEISEFDEKLKPKTNWSQKFVKNMFEDIFCCFGEQDTKFLKF
jgi:hypothetical protein